MSTQLEEMDGPPSGMPVDPDGRPIPLELGMFQQFYACRTQSGTTTLRETTDGADGARRTLLPSLSPSKTSVRRIRDQLLFDGSKPGRYFRAITKGDGLCPLETRFVYREGAAYVTFACYRVPNKRAEKKGIPLDCYYISTAPVNDPASLTEVVESTTRQVIADLMALRRGPGAPHMGDLRPFLRSETTSIGDGAIEEEYRPGDSARPMRIDRGRLAGLSRNEKKAAREILRELESDLALPRGEVPDHEPEVLARVLQELIPICAMVLDRIADEAWPPFGSHSAIDRFVQENFTGDATIERSLATVLKGPERRPAGGREFAMRVLSEATGLTRDRLRRLTRV